MKKAAQAAESPVEAVKTPTELVLGVFSSSLQAIQREIDAIAGGKVVIGGDEVVRVANLASKAAAIAGEIRKIEKADATGIRELTPAVVLTWVRMQTPECRARLVKDMTAMDSTSRRSVLG